MRIMPRTGTAPGVFPEAEAVAADAGSADWSWLALRADGGGWQAPIPEADLAEQLRDRPSTVHALPRGERAMLACLRWWRAGAPVGVLARDAGMPEAAAVRILRSLADGGYARCWREVLYWGHGHRQIVCWGGDVTSQRWLDALPRLPVPVPPTSRCPEGLPPEFWKHFWSGTDPAVMRLPDDGELIASVLIYEEHCTLAKSWALCNLPSDALAAARELRGLSDRGLSSIRAELARRGTRGGS